MARHAPGPKGLPIIGCLPEFRKDVLGLMMRSFSHYGDIVRVTMGPLIIHQVSHPDAVKQVLKDITGFDKNTRASKMISRVSGESVLISHGEVWQRQRRLLQPAFASQSLKGFFSTMAEATDELIDHLQKRADRDEPVDIASLMMRLTYRIVEKTLFSTDDAEDMGGLEQAIGIVLADVYRRIESPLAIPHWIPSRSNRRYARAMATLNERVFKLINAHRHGAGDDLLHRLCRESSFSDEELRNETITLMIAGHETTANALSWLWYLLLQHPESEEAMVAELPSGPLLPEHVAELEYTKRTINEAMRLYPPIWTMVRRVVTEQEVGGYLLPANSRVIVSPYVIHRHPEFWQEPEKFDPLRKIPDHHFAYLPFGAGPRLCIGHNFARMEAVIIAAKLLQRFRFELVKEHRVILHAGITLRARDGIRVRVRTR